MLERVSDGPRPTRWLEVGSALWTTAEAIYLVGLIVYAFGVGGAPLVALVTVLQSLPSVVLAPAFMGATTRMRRPQLLAGVLTVRCVTVAAAGILLATNGPVVGVLALVAIDGLASTVLRPVRGMLVPMIARSPDELVAANVGITTGMSVASLLGPAVAAVILARRQRSGDVPPRVCAVRRRAGDHEPAAGCCRHPGSTPDAAARSGRPDGTRAVARRADDRGSDRRPALHPGHADRSRCDDRPAAAAVGRRGCWRAQRGRRPGHGAGQRPVRRPRRPATARRGVQRRDRPAGDRPRGSRARPARPADDRLLRRQRRGQGDPRDRGEQPPPADRPDRGPRPGPRPPRVVRHRGSCRRRGDRVMLVDRLGPTGVLLAAGGLEVALVVIQLAVGPARRRRGGGPGASSSASCAAWPSSGRSS